MRSFLATGRLHWATGRSLRATGMSQIREKQDEDVVNFPTFYDDKRHIERLFPHIFSQFFAFESREESSHSLMRHRMLNKHENQTFLCQFDAGPFLRFFANFDASGEGPKPCRPIQIKYYL